MITCAYGQILSKEILNIPRFGVINIHASLLPKYRGASPIHFALLNGEKETGVTIMKTEVGVDTGDMILSRKININYDETCGELFERLSTLGSEMILEVLPTIFDGSAKLIPQDDKLATYTKIFRKQDALIDWGDAAENIYNKIRAFNPSPVAYCSFNGEPFKIYKAKVVGMSGKAGEILKADNELVIGCGKDALSLLIVQKAGGKAMGIGDFLNGNKFSKGEFFN
jgi:methionyl-tRNA formyltransferase